MVRILRIKSRCARALARVVSMSSQDVSTVPPEWKAMLLLIVHVGIETLRCGRGLEMEQR
jgi:hypothetical protein